MEGKKINVGGQAVIEGVMIRGPQAYVIALRKGKGIVTKQGIISKRKSKMLKLPLIRGAVNLGEMLVVGIKALMWSAEQASPEEEKPGKNELALTLLLSLVLVIVFFIALPYFLTNLIGVTEES